MLKRILLIVGFFKTYKSRQEVNQTAKWELVISADQPQHGIQNIFHGNYQIAIDVGTTISLFT